MPLAAGARPPTVVVGRHTEPLFWMAPRLLLYPDPSLVACKCVLLQFCGLLLDFTTVAFPCAGMPPLCHAARTGDPEVLHYLLDDCKCDVNGKGIGGMTALMLAALNFHEPIVLELLKQGAKVDITDDCGNTALHYAAQGGSLACITPLVMHNGTQKPPDSTLVSTKNIAGRTAMHIACNHGQQAVVSSLLKGGAVVDDTDNKGLTALVRTCCIVSSCSVAFRLSARMRELATLPHPRHNNTCYE